MQHQHSCGTLECRVEIFDCMVQELYITLYPLDHYPLIHRACVHIKDSQRSPNPVETKAILAHISNLIFLAVGPRYDVSKWPHETILFRLHLQDK